MARVPLWKLRRLAPRAKRVIERRKGDAPVIAAYEHTVTPAADRYMAAYDRATQMRGSWKLEAQERQEAVNALAVSLSEKLDAAGKEHTEAEVADKDYQQCLADVRGTFPHGHA